VIGAVFCAKAFAEKKKRVNDNVKYKRNFEWLIIIKRIMNNGDNMKSRRKNTEFVPT